MRHAAPYTQAVFFYKCHILLKEIVSQPDTVCMKRIFGASPYNKVTRDIPQSGTKTNATHASQYCIEVHAAISITTSVSCMNYDFGQTIQDRIVRRGTKALYQLPHESHTTCSPRVDISVIPGGGWSSSTSETEESERASFLASTFRNIIQVVWQRCAFG